MQFSPHQPASQSVILHVGNQFIVEHVTPRPAEGEPGTLKEQRAKVYHHIDCLSPTLRIYDPDGEVR